MPPSRVLYFPLKHSCHNWTCSRWQCWVKGDTNVRALPHGTFTSYACLDEFHVAVEILVERCKSSSQSQLCVCLLSITLWSSLISYPGYCPISPISTPPIQSDPQTVLCLTVYRSPGKFTWFYLWSQSSNSLEMWLATWAYPFYQTTVESY